MSNELYFVGDVFDMDPVSLDDGFDTLDKALEYAKNNFPEADEIEISQVSDRDILSYINVNDMLEYVYSLIEDDSIEIDSADKWASKITEHHVDELKEIIYKWATNNNLHPEHKGIDSIQTYTIKRN